MTVTPLTMLTNTFAKEAQATHILKIYFCYTPPPPAGAGPALIIADCWWLLLVTPHHHLVAPAAGPDLIGRLP